MGLRTTTLRLAFVLDLAAAFGAAFVTPADASGAVGFAGITAFPVVLLAELFAAGAGAFFLTAVVDCPCAIHTTAKKIAKSRKMPP